MLLPPYTYCDTLCSNASLTFTQLEHGHLDESVTLSIPILIWVPICNGILNILINTSIMVLLYKAV
jgi:hypothetical protein